MTDLYDGAVALIRHPESQPTKWLVRYKQPTGQLGLVMTTRLENESPRESIDRELAWQLRLNRGRDYLISSVARLYFDELLTIPGESAARRFRIQFYLVQPYGRSCCHRLMQDPECHWLSRTELLNGLAADGQSVCAITRILLTAADVIGRNE